MDTKRYLKQIVLLEKKIKYKLEEIERLRTLVGVSGMNYDKENIQTSKKYDPMGDKVAEIVELERVVKEYMKQRRAIIEQIDNMEQAKYYEVLTNRYVLDKDWYTIADTMGITTTTVMRLHHEALEEFKKIVSDRK